MLENNKRPLPREILSVQPLPNKVFKSNLRHLRHKALGSLFPGNNAFKEKSFLENLDAV
jgi:hypothetical protein